MGDLKDSTEKSDTGLSLNEYSNKYHISISTLRRRIRSGRIRFYLKAGKYFLRDVKPENIQLLDQLQLPKNNQSPQKKKMNLDSVTPDIKLSNLKSQSVLDQFLISQRDLYKQLELKNQKITDLQNQLADLQTLTALLEKENKQLKALSKQEQALEDWFDGTKGL